MDPERLKAFLSDPAVPEEAKQRAAQLYRAGQQASLKDVRKSLATPEGREASRGAGEAVLKGTATIAGAGLGGVPGAFTGYGLTSEAIDLAKGRVPSAREAVEVGASLLPEVGPISRALRLGSNLVRRGAAAGLSAGIAGQAYDVATGRRETPGEALGTATTDVTGGALTPGLQASAERRIAARTARRGVLPEAEQAFRRDFAEREGIPLSASGRTGSRGVAQVEATPRRVPVGAGVVDEFYIRQAEARDQMMERHLTRLDALQNRDPTTIGRELNAEVDRLGGRRGVIQQQANHGYGWIDRQLTGRGDNVITPRHLVERARALESEGITPPSPAGAVGEAHRISAQAQPPLLVDQNGTPIATNLTDLAQWTEHHRLTYRQTKFLLGQLAERAGYDQATTTMSTRSRQGLREALETDLRETLTRHPDLQQVDGWMDQAYGEMQDRMRDHVRRLLDRPDVEQILGNAISAGGVDRMENLREVVDRPVWERAVAATIRRMWDTARDPSTGEWSERRFATNVRRFMVPGPDGRTQLQIMMEHQPEERAFLEDMVRFSPALGSTQKLAGNPPETASALMSGAQLAGLAQPFLRPTSPAAYAEAAGAAAPYPLARYVFSPGGIDTLSGMANRGVLAPLTDPILANRLATASAGRGLAEGLPPDVAALGPQQGPPVPDWILRQVLSVLGR